MELNNLIRDLIQESILIEERATPAKRLKLIQRWLKDIKSMPDRNIKRTKYKLGSKKLDGFEFILNDVVKQPDPLLDGLVIKTIGDYDIEERYGEINIRDNEIIIYENDIYVTDGPDFKFTIKDFFNFNYGWPRVFTEQILSLYSHYDSEGKSHIGYSEKIPEKRQEEPDFDSAPKNNRELLYKVHEDYDGEYYDLFNDPDEEERMEKYSDRYWEMYKDDIDDWLEFHPDGQKLASIRKSNKEISDRNTKTRADNLGNSFAFDKAFNMAVYEVIKNAEHNDNFNRYLGNLKHSFSNVSGVDFNDLSSNIQKKFLSRAYTTYDELTKEEN
jgi:hypothetical protein